MLGQGQSAAVLPSAQTGVTATATVTIADSSLTTPTAGPVDASTTVGKSTEPAATSVPFPSSPTADSSTATSLPITDARQAAAHELAQILSLIHI